MYIASFHLTYLIANGIPSGSIAGFTGIVILKEKGKCLKHDVETIN